MHIIKRDELPSEHLPGRIIRQAVGKNSFCESRKITVGFAFYSAKEEMKPHFHAEEVLYLLSCKNAWIAYGDNANNLKNRIKMKAGMIIHIQENEWHRFIFDDGEGFADLIFIYGQVTNIRPEGK